jgi:hypothetical protein
MFATISKVFELLSVINVQGFIGGSVASSLHGLPRATMDIDVIINISHFHVDSMMNAFSDEFYIDQDMVTDAVKSLSSFNVICLSNMIKVDFFILKRDEYARQEFSRVVLKSFVHKGIEYSLPFTTP